MAIVAEDSFGSDVYATEAAIKKHEALQADVKVCVRVRMLCMFFIMM